MGDFTVSINPADNQIAELRSENRALTAERDALRAQVERMREALVTVVAVVPDNGLHGPYGGALYLARAALR